jgi:chemotaxis methyl-accepting protein methylase
MNKAFDQLDDLSKDVSQNIANPQTKQIVESFKNKLLEYTDDAGTIAIEDAQKLTQDFNKQLTAFFRNPNMNDVSKNSIISQLNKWTKDAINESIDDVLNQ